MSSKKFTRDLSQGHEYEKKAEDYFEFDTVEHKEGFFKEYDFIFYKDGKPTTVEVKSDRLSSKTGNLCIEHTCNNKPSGIDATTADYWLYFSLWGTDGIYGPITREEAYLIPTDELRELAPRFRSVHGGDGKRSQMYIIPKRNVKKYIALPLEKENGLAEVMEKLKV